MAEFKQVLFSCKLCNSWWTQYNSLTIFHLKFPSHFRHFWNYSLTFTVLHFKVIIFIFIDLVIGSRCCLWLNKGTDLDTFKVKEFKCCNRTLACAINSWSENFIKIKKIKKLSGRSRNFLFVEILFYFSITPNVPVPKRGCKQDLHDG